MKMKEENALAKVFDFSAPEPELVQDRFLPRFQLVFDIQAADFPQGAVGKCVIKGSGQTVVLDKPYTIVRLKHVKAVRKPGDDTYWEYARDGEDKYEEYKGHPNAEHGIQYLLALIYEGKVALVTMGSFKTQRTYWGTVMSQTHAKDGTAVDVKVVDHKDNFVVDGKKRYYSSSKFTQWEQRDLTQDEMKLIAEAISNEAEKVKNW